MKELNIQIPEGYEVDKEQSTFEKIIFKKIETKLPKTWEENNKNILQSYSDEDIFYEYKKREFKNINVGDIVLCFGIRGPEKMIVKTKTRETCNLETVEGSYTRTYHEIITKLSPYD